MRMSLLIFLIFLSLSTILMKRPKQTLNLSLLTSIVGVAWGFLDKPRHSGFVLKNKNIRLLYIFSRLSQRLNATDGPWKENAETVCCWFGRFMGFVDNIRTIVTPCCPLKASSYAAVDELSHHHHHHHHSCRCHQRRHSVSYLDKWQLYDFEAVGVGVLVVASQIWLTYWWIISSRWASVCAASACTCHVPIVLVQKKKHIKPQVPGLLGSI